VLPCSGRQKVLRKLFVSSKNARFSLMCRQPNLHELARKFDARNLCKKLVCHHHYTSWVTNCTCAGWDLGASISGGINETMCATSGGMVELTCVRPSDIRTSTLVTSEFCPSADTRQSHQISWYQGSYLFLTAGTINTSPNHDASILIGRITCLGLRPSVCLSVCLCLTGSELQNVKA